MNVILNQQWRRILMGIAITLVILSHLDLFSKVFNNDFLLHDFFKTGGVGVTIFLFLSSYGLCHSFSRNKVHRFYGNRLKRIFPVYLIFLFLMIYVQHPEYPYIEKIKLLLMQSSGLVVFTSESYMIEWYTPSLIVIYILFPFMFMSIRKILPFGGGKYWLILIISMIGNYIGTNDLLGLKRLAFNIPILALGIITFFNKEKDKELLKIYLFTALCGLVFYERSHKEILTIPLFLYACSLLINASKKQIENSIAYKTISTFGIYSYEIYLSQQLAMFFFKMEFPIGIEYLVVFLLTLILFVTFIIIQNPRSIFKAIKHKGTI